MINKETNRNNNSSNTIILFKHFITEDVSFKYVLKILKLLRLRSNILNFQVVTGLVVRYVVVVEGALVDELPGVVERVGLRQRRVHVVRLRDHQHVVQPDAAAARTLEHPDTRVYYK